MGSRTERCGCLFLPREGARSRALQKAGSSGIAAAAEAFVPKVQKNDTDLEFCG